MNLKIQMKASSMAYHIKALENIFLLFYNL
jgi:hypothetical protein